MKRYFELFDPSQIKIMLYEDLRNEPVAFMQELFEFVGVDNNFEPDMSVQYNVSGKIKNKYVDLLVGQQSLIRRGLEKISPTLIQNVRESRTMQKIVTNLRKKNLERVPLSNEVRKRLIEEIYKDEIVSFGNLIQRDLSHWLSVEKESNS